MNRPQCLIACLLLALCGCQSAPEPAPATGEGDASAQLLADSFGDALQAQVDEFERGLRPLQKSDGSGLHPAYSHLSKWRGRLAAAMRTWDMAVESGDLSAAAARAQDIFPQLEIARADLLEAQLHKQSAGDDLPNSPEEWREGR